MATPMLQPTNGTIVCVASAETAEPEQAEPPISRADHHAIIQRVRGDALKIRDALQRHVDRLELELTRAREERHDFKIRCDRAGCRNHFTLTTGTKLEPTAWLNLATSIGWTIGIPTRERCGWPVLSHMTNTVDECPEHRYGQG